MDRRSLSRSAADQVPSPLASPPPPRSSLRAVEPDQEPSVLSEDFLAHDASAPGDMPDEMLAIVFDEDVLAQRQQLSDHGITLVGELDHAGGRQLDGPVHDGVQRNVARDREVMNEGQRD